MKRLTQRQRQRQERLSRWAIALLQESNSRGLRGTKKHIRRNRKSSVAIVCEAPEMIRFHLYADGRETFENFIFSVDHALDSSQGKVKIDLQKVKRLYPCGLLLLMGYVDSWVERFPGRLIANYPEDDLVEQMLQQVGTLQKLGLKARKEVSHSDVTRWHYFTGKNVDAEKIEPFMEQISDLVGEEAQLGLGGCINEAMTNVKHHAYTAKDGGRWWMFGTVNERRVFVAMHDRGASIPGTLLAKPQFRDYLIGRPLLKNGRADGGLIKAAAGGRTRTQLPYRGKGLREMVEFTKSTPKSSLAIYSRRGFFRLSNDQEKVKEESGRLSRSVDGTLVMWAITIGEANDAKP